MLRLLTAVAATPSVTVIVKVYVPATLGVPLMTPPKPVIFNLQPVPPAGETVVASPEAML
jgi:hypothetical protein